VLIPFNAKFSKEDSDYDPLIEDKLTTDKALSYLLNKAIAGAQRLMKNGGFTESATVKKALDNYKIENSTVLTWLYDEDLDADYLTEKSTNELYSTFTDWCKNSGIKANSITGKKTFYKEIITKFNFEDKPKQRADGLRYFIYKL